MGTNYLVTEAVQKVAESYKCKPIEGMLSHQLKQFKIDGEKTIIQNPSEQQRKEHEKCNFETHEVYAIDVIISTGEGIGREKDTKVSIYKKTEENYQLKLKASRSFFAEVKSKHGSMPFNLRQFEEETKARMGVVECVSHKMIDPFQVFPINAKGINLVTGIPFEEDVYVSEHSVTDEKIKELLATPINPSKASKGKKGPKKSATASDPAPAAVPTKA
uniref:Proliferation-associated protein 2G4 n=1 Tax=Megaselia scalaris TaxID=36166 RepID=T1GVB0_MEGSC